MLSNPNGLHPRQRQHRRQQSTPTAFEGVKIPHLPNTTQRHAAGHRRGLSLDIRRQHNSTSPTARQNFMVSTTTNNTGLANTSQHNVLREAQQQRIQARPGTQHPYVTLAPSGSENYLISPHGTPQAQRFDPSCFDPNNISFDAYSGDLNMMMGKGQAAYGENMSGGRDFDLFNNDSALSTPTFMSFQESPSAQGWASEGDTSSTRRTSRRISNGIMDRVNKFETLGADGLPTRPITPPSGNVQNYYPPTPMETPQDRLAKAEPTPSRFQDGYDESMEETIKPVRNRGGNQRAQTIFQDMRKQSEQQQPQQQAIISSPPKPNQMPEADNFNNLPLQTPDYMSMNNFNNEFMKIENNFDMTQQISQHTSPDTPQMAQFVGGFNKPDLSPYPLDAQSLSAIPSNCPSRHESPHRRTESLASIASAASIADINIEETKTETGVTLEEISQYIQGPDAADGKWMCLYEECGKKFGRKENIKSHVQTHLNDRQYQCPTCKKCFVRQHDLKRHAKIHTGIKPYPCECGNSFARHDALTRHRQRGMCIGAFDGIVRKVVKRGRPKKNRPDMETRLEKSARTRKKNLSVSSVSSFSGYSDSSAGNSPDADFNMLDDMVDIGMSQQTQNLASVSSAPMTSIPAPAISDMASSPSAASAHSYVSPEALMEGTPVNPTSPAKSAAGSQYNTPPELSQSSSPPPHQYFEVEPNTSLNTDDLSTLSGTSAIMGSSSMNGTLPLGMSDHDDDMLLQFANDDGLVQLDRESSMLMMSKFDEEFDNAVMFGTNTDDVFFGSN